MLRDPSGRLMALCLWLVLLSPIAASAQSAIAGVVKDTSGAVLPGVTVEAASPVLIEKTRAVVTDGEGQYKIIDLRPGTYTVTFTLTGFNTVRREGVVLSANFTAPVNAELRVGTVEETVTVTGASPTVDVQNSLVQNVMNRELLDAIPTGRSYQSVAQTTPGIVLDRPDSAGSEAFFSTNLSVHGSGTSDQSIQIDGMDTTDGESDGRFQGMYRDDGDNEEVVYSTSAITAETSKGGVRINMIGRQGSNEYKGSFFGAYAPGSWQSSNFSDDLKTRGLSTPNSMKRIFDWNPTLGGPLQRDRIWFFSSFRIWGVDKYAAGAFNPDGSRALDDAQHISVSTRITTQVSERNKLTLYYARMVRRTLFHRFIAPNVSPEATSLQTTPIGYSAQAKWTRPISSRVLVDAGFSTTFVHPKIFPQPFVVANPSVVAKRDLTLGTSWNAYPTQSDLYKGRRYYEGSLAYVTGSHAFKVGAQMSEVRSRNTTNVNQDLIQEYRNGLPTNVTVYNTPTDQQVRLLPDLGLYGQDSWTLKRVTVNAGLRYEYFQASTDVRDLPAGRFAPARHFDTIEDLPKWSNFTPRLGVVYDLFGTARTAIRGSVSKYMVGESVAFTERYNPSVTVTDRRTWTDRNGDDIAQDSEIGPSNQTNFGTRANRNPDPNIDRPYHIEYNLGVQHELLPRVSLSVNYFRRRYYAMAGQKNLLVGFDGYTPVTITNPVDGTPLVVYNLKPQNRGLSDLLDYTSETDTRKYNGMDIVMNARLGRGTVFGAVTTGKTQTVACDVADPNLLRFCDNSAFVPWQSQYKLSGAYSLPYGLQLSGTFQSNPGNPVNAQASGVRTAPEAGLQVLYNVTPTILPGLTQPQVTLNLIDPGTKYLDRINQLDVRVGKRLTMGKVTLDGNLDVFNLLNTNVVMRVTETYGTALDRPLEIPQGRLFRVSLMTRF